MSWRDWWTAWNWTWRAHMPRRHSIGPTATTGTSTTGRLHWHLGCHVSLSATIASLVVGGIQWVTRWGENQTTKSQIKYANSHTEHTFTIGIGFWMLLDCNKKELVWKWRSPKIGLMRYCADCKQELASNFHAQFLHHSDFSNRKNDLAQNSYI